MAEIALARGQREIAAGLLRVSHETLTKVGDLQELARTQAVVERLQEHEEQEIRESAGRSTL
jgi:hypothetical protein